MVADHAEAGDSRFREPRQALLQLLCCFKSVFNTINYVACEHDGIYFFFKGVLYGKQPGSGWSQVAR